LYENNPELNRSIYIDGVKVIDRLLKQEGLSEDRKSRLQDSLLLMYDKRIEYFNEEATVMDRKAYEAFKMYYRNPSKYAMLVELYDEAFALNGKEISNFNLAPYMTLAKYYHQAKPEEFPAEKVLEVHSTVTNAIDEKMKMPSANSSRLIKEQDKADALLSSIGNILSCEFIENNLVPKFEENPEDLNLAKKIFKYSLQAKCTDQPYFLKAGDMVYETDPNYKLAYALGNKYVSSGELEKAIQYFQSAVELSELKEDKYDAYMALADTYAKSAQKSKSRSMAYEALSVKPGASTPYEHIGNLYFSSFEDCKQGESKVLDRAIFLAAYKMYQKAGNSERMQAAKEQFPSIEEIFNDNYEEGEEVTVDCWVNETVKLQRRN
jgi:tetratricopeptide (TPR) repeat protein